MDAWGTISQQREAASAAARRVRALMAAAVGVVAIVIALPAAADEKPAVIAVVDGSGSMWGTLANDTVSKLAATRQALDEVLPAVAGSVRLGLATFGPGCRSADVVVPASEGDTSLITSALAKFNPRGKGPLTAGLRAAAATFGDRGGGDIILFHDGLDNCGEDACAAAALIHAGLPGIRIHTVSLGLVPAEAAAIGCLAKVTGGSASTVVDAGGVANAVRAITATIAERSRRPVAPVVTAPVPVQPVIAEKGPPRLVAAASLATGQPPIASALAWTIKDVRTGRVLHQSVAPTLALPLPAGPVRVEVASGSVAERRDAEIASEGDTVVDIPLNAGIVRLDTGVKRLASDAEEPTIRLDTSAPAEARTGGLATAAPLWIARGKAIEALLPPGEYEAIGEYGLVRRALSISVKAGETLNLSLPLEAGRLELVTRPERIGDITFEVTADAPDRPGGRREIARSAFAAPAFVLSTGSYYVVARGAGHEFRRLVAVRSGEITRETFQFEPATLEVGALVNGAQAGGTPLALSIAPASAAAGAAPTERSIETGKAITIAPGRYRVSLRHAHYDAAVSRDITLAAGQSLRLPLDLETAELQLDLAAGVAHGAMCEIAGADGTVFHRTVELEPRLVVTPGRYLLRCRSSAATREFAVALAAGEVKLVQPFDR